MAEFSIIDQYFNRQSHPDVALGIGDDSALITPLQINNWSSVPIHLLLDVTSLLKPRPMRLAGKVLP